MPKCFLLENFNSRESSYDNSKFGNQTIHNPTKHQQKYNMGLHHVSENIWFYMLQPGYIEAYLNLT